MATTGHGLTYPLAGEASENVWEHLQTLANNIETALNTYEAFTTWTPSWSVGPTTIGTGGFNEGFHQRVGNRVHVEFRFQLGTGFAFTGGTFVLNLPVAAHVWSGTAIQSTYGRWILRDESATTHYAGTIGGWDAAGLQVSFAGSFTSSVPNSRVSSTAGNPITWAAGDIFSGNMTYRAA